jgi:hypothetical protein
MHRVKTVGSLKTLAQKYKTSLKKKFRKYGVGRHNREQTVAFVVLQTVEGITYAKKYKLLTYKKVMELTKKTESQRKTEKRFWDIEKGRFSGEFTHAFWRG